VRQIIKLGLCSLLLTIAPVIQAAMVHASGTVTVILTYLNHGQGDFTFRISNPPSGCNTGYWISPSQPGFRSAVAFVMQAKATGETILVGADTAQLWNGSGDQWCKVDYVGTPY
jgi:hypothetical protein